MNSRKHAILFFDGDCGICSRSVRFLMKRDRAGTLHYAPLQGKTAKQLLSEALREERYTAVYLPARRDELLLRSNAVLQATIDIKSNWRLAARLALRLPRSWRDKAYDWVANNRTRFGSKEPCALPKADETTQILP